MSLWRHPFSMSEFVSVPAFLKNILESQIEKYSGKSNFLLTSEQMFDIMIFVIFVALCGKITKTEYWCQHICGLYARQRLR